MNQNLKPSEREIIKLVNFFRKRAEKLVLEGKLSAEHEQVSIACEKLVNKLYTHAGNRSDVLERRRVLEGIIKDNASCPKCGKNTHIKHIGSEKHEQGWSRNKYKCRRCNIEFLWNRPNNPWDMVIFINHFIEKLETGLLDVNIDPELKQQSEGMILQMKDSLDKLLPIIETSDTELRELNERETEMAKMLHDLKNYLLIEKIKMDSWDAQPGAN
jgi:hypothetical protein